MTKQYYVELEQLVLMRGGVEVEAENAEAAIRNARDYWENGDIDTYPTGDRTIRAANVIEVEGKG